MPTSPEHSLAPVSLFYSYSHKDEAIRDELETHLSLLRRQGVIRNWHDREMTAGTEWKGQIDRNLDAADVILLLISADFLASDYCYDIEMRRALERHEAGTARVIPVILRPCDWHPAPFGKLQALPKDVRPVTTWKDRDEAFTDIAWGIRKVVVSLAAGAQNLSTSNQDEALPKNLVPPPSQLRDKSEYVLAEQLVTFLENKRVLYSRVSSRCPGGVVKSVEEIRAEVQRVRENLLRENLSRDSTLFKLASLIHTTVFNLFEYACQDCKFPSTCDDCRIREKGCVEGLLEFRKEMGEHIASICSEFHLEVNEPLKLILPNGEKQSLQYGICPAILS